MSEFKIGTGKYTVSTPEDRSERVSIVAHKGQWDEKDITEEIAPLKLNGAFNPRGHLVAEVIAEFAIEVASLTNKVTEQQKIIDGAVTNTPFTDTVFGEKPIDIGTVRALNDEILELRKRLGE